jgi:murein L,D-transpeptidase YafK
MVYGLWFAGGRGRRWLRSLPSVPVGGGIRIGIKKKKNATTKVKAWNCSISFDPPFHLAFNLGYPNVHDRAQGYTGGALMVHGGCVSIGCFAMTDGAMEEIYALAHAALSNGQTYFWVHIFPFEMTPENMNRHRDSKWFDFWRRLKAEYDGFPGGDRSPRMPPHDGSPL